MTDRLNRRLWPVVISVVFVGLGLAYSFRWGSVVRHTPSLWISPPDLSSTYQASVALAHGAFASIYQRHGTFLAYPGILVALLPLGALGNVVHTAFVEIAKNHHLVTNPQVLLSHPAQVWDSGTIVSKSGIEYAVQPQWFALVAPYVMALSCSALFACDALAERLGVTRRRRLAMGVGEAVVLWPMVVAWGHPEDAVAVALALYALMSALDGRFGAAGWLFGAALAVQPLVIMMFPVLLVLGGGRRALGLVVRGVVPAAVVTAPPLVAAFHVTTTNLLQQQAWPYVKGDHLTPWTALAPRIGGRGTTTTVGGGPTRVAVLVLAAGLGWWARRWRERPELVVWSVAVALALRLYLESVMTSYYVWPALAVGLVVVAARGTPWRFGVALALAGGVTVVAQWSLGWLPWWVIDVVGVTALLALAAVPGAPAADLRPVGARRPPAAPPSTVRADARAATRKRQKRKTARTARKRSGRR